MALQFILFGIAAASLNAMRDHDVDAKVQGRCASDEYTCPDGSLVLRSADLSCRFSPCAGQTSLVEASNTQPTFQWTGVSIADNQNFCTQMTGALGSYQDNSVTDCTAQTSAVCETKYKHILDGNVGDIAHCEKDGATGCKQGAVHNCTWSFYMEDLMTKHAAETTKCAGRLLESKRSLDGLLHSVQDVYNQLMQWNAIVQAENGTIRNLLTEQQANWDVYVSAQTTCETTYTNNRTAGQKVGAEMELLRDIANPVTRSAVDFSGQGGYQETARAGYTPPARSALLEMDESAQYDEKTCEAFSSLVERVEENHGLKLGKVSADCHTKRTELQTLFNQGFSMLGKLYNDLIAELEISRTVCLNTATYEYKSSVEGIDGIDDKIQDSAGKIHEAQGQIAKLEPMLHDVERAVDRMRTYVTKVTTECGDEEYLGNVYEQIKTKIEELMECPGRNDFKITIPHWTPTSATNVPTPNPTPWYSDPKAAADRPKL